jgi:hypothetical protein
LVGGESEIILDCYRLARFFHCSPDTFLSLPLSEVWMHLKYADTLSKAEQSASDD